MSNRILDHFFKGKPPVQWFYEGMKEVEICLAFSTLQPTVKGLVMFNLVFGETMNDSERRL